MDKPNDSPEPDEQQQQLIRIKLVDLQEGEQLPDLAVYAVDRSFKPIFTAHVDAEGRVDLPQDVLSKAALVVVGPRTENLAELDRTTLVQYRAGELLRTRRNLLRTRSALPARPGELLRPPDQLHELEIPKGDWGKWQFVRYCVSGSVSHCYPYIWLIRDLMRQAAHIEQPQLQAVQPLTAHETIPNVGQLNRKTQTALNDQALARPFWRPPFWPRCEVVCDGIVEVYQRTCCRPWIVDDPRLPELIADLKQLILKLPKLRRPPIPEPDPPPFHELPFLQEGALDEQALNATRDLEAITKLSKAEQAAYIQARPYLWCRRWCSTPVKVSQGSIRPDGKFHICWFGPREPLQLNCHSEYAYVVKQVFNGQTITIYNGVAANRWFHYDDDAVLVSYHPHAQGCRHNDFPGEGAFALLQDIGLTGSYRLKTPDATGWDRVATPVYNDGLADPEPNPALALGQYKNRNWGGTLLLRYHFSEDMKGASAHYYRVSISAADANGNPTGPRTYLTAPVSWKKYVTIGSDVNIASQTLGPNSAGSENNLFVIPYDADADWQSGQYHATLNTREFTNGRFMITLEVFNSAGQRIRPTGASGPGVDAGFTFRRWFQEIGPTAEVPFAALTHMFWWDNRKAEAEIVDLRNNNVPSVEECQFLVGDNNASFSVGYRAYHEQSVDPLFILNHSLWWRRGLSGPTGYLVNANPNNVGLPPNPPGVSGGVTFATMLENVTPKKCSFSLNLYVNVKTFNGIGTLDDLDDWDYASFALERTGP